MKQVTISGKFWTCFSKQTLSGCVEVNSDLLNPTGRELWPSNSSDAAFQGSFPENPWLTNWKSFTLTNFQLHLEFPKLSFVGNKIDAFVVSGIDNENPMFSKLFQNSQSFPVKTFVIGQYQYVFFHDNANEARSSYYDFDEPEKEFRRFSRVGRFCVNETSSFVVARLLCGIAKDSLSEKEKYKAGSSAYDHQFLEVWNVISDIDFDSSVSLFYATFNMHYLPKGMETDPFAF